MMYICSSMSWICSAIVRTFFLLVAGDLLCYQRDGLGLLGLPVS